MSALFDRRSPLHRSYYRRVRNAAGVAVATHAMVLAFAPGSLPRPPRMPADALVVLDAMAPATGSALVPKAPSPKSPAAPASRELPSLVEDAVVRTETATAAAPASGASTAAGAPASATGGRDDGGAAEDAPPVFYAYDTPPRPVRRVLPGYPADARLQGIEGTVVINANVDERGRVLRAWVAQSTAAEVLVNTALDAVYEFEFRPGTQRGIPVRCTVAIPFQFRLREGVTSDGGE